MEDDNRLDLSLGPPLTAKTATATGKTGGVDDMDTKLINEFKHFLDGGTMQFGPSMLSPRKPENFYGNNLSTVIDLETSKDFQVGGFWTTKDRHIDVDEENSTDVREKRKNVFGETSQQKKHVKDTDHSDLHDKPRASHMSINADDGSMADNEDVADSAAEADGSTSRLLLQADNVTRGRSLTEVYKNIHGSHHVNSVELQVTNRCTVSLENDFKTENASRCVLFPNQPANIMSLNQLNSAGMNIRTPYPLHGMMQGVASTSNERTASQSAFAVNFPLLGGYNPAQLPKMDNQNSTGRIYSEKHNDGTPPNSSEFRHDTKAVDHTLGSVKQMIDRECAEDSLKGISTTSRPNLVMDQPTADGFPSDYRTIKPGIAADVKFGGSGSYPNLPWVSTTGTGPKGRTISGVTYRYNSTQFRIVCACHGIHLSPMEFVRHASEEPVNQDASIGVGNVPNSNPDALARS